MVRATLARRYYQRLRAVHIIMNRFRRYKLRSYIVDVHNTFRNVRQVRDLGKSLPWPKPPAVLQSFARRLQHMHALWRANIILSRMPPHLRESLPQKLAAFETFNRRRPEWGYTRRWIGDYLSLEEEHEKPGSANKYRHALELMARSYAFNKVLFSSYIHKINKFNKSTLRILLITDKFVVKMDTKKFKPLKEPSMLSSIKSLSVSSLSNNLIVLHVGSNDFIGCLHNHRNEDRVGELVGTLQATMEAEHNRKLPVAVEQSVACVLGSKPRCLKVNSAEINQPVLFKFSGTDIELTCPAGA
jgi:myosin-1